MTGPFSTTKTGISPQTGPVPLSAQNISSSGPVGSSRFAVFQDGADAVTGKNTNTFTVHRYPQDIATNEIPHYVMFYVNVRKGALSSEVPSDVSTVNFDQSSKNGLPSETKAMSAATGLTGGAALGSQLASSTGLSGSGSPFALFGAGAGLTFTQNSDTFKTLVQGDTTVLIKDVVALYLSGKPSVQYSASWADIDLGMANALGERFGDAMGDLGGIVGDLTKFDWLAMKTKASNAYHDLFKNSSAIAASLILRSADKSNGAFGNFGAAIQADAAIIPNPFKAQLFHTMGFRTFTFDYTFLPRNKQEYQEVQAIIRTFKKYMHPVVGGDKFIMQYPAEFSIAYYYKGATNDELFKMTNCALTTCKVEYGGTDFTTFKRIPGAPTEISVQLAFVETELLTRAHIEDGY